MAFVIAEHDVRVARAEDDPAVLYDARSGGPDHIGLVLKHAGKGGAITVTIEAGGEPESHRLQKGEATVLVLLRPRRITAWSDGDSATLAFKLLAEEPRPEPQRQAGHGHDRGRGGGTDRGSRGGHGHSEGDHRGHGHEARSHGHSGHHHREHHQRSGHGHRDGHGRGHRHGDRDGGRRDHRDDGPRDHRN
jgi:hypothetical protein